MASQGSASSVGFWDLDEPLPGRSRRIARAAAVSAVWVLAALPVVFGWQACPVATFLHRPCPGCGMTRAIRLLIRGDFAASLRMHALALPVLVAGVLLAVATVWATWVAGSPVRLVRTRLGRFAIGLAVVTYAGAILLWVLRCFGYFGGPVTV
jgi:Protein of unknown function (DUF2752)